MTGSPRRAIDALARRAIDALPRNEYSTRSGDRDSTLAPRELWRIGCARAKRACSERGDAILLHPPFIHEQSEDSDQLRRAGLRGRGFSGGPFRLERQSARARVDHDFGAVAHLASEDF